MEMDDAFENYNKTGSLKGIGLLDNEPSNVYVQKPTLDIRKMDRIREALNFCVENMMHGDQNKKLKN